MSKLVKLPSGMILDLDRVVFLGKDNNNIGKYLVVIEGANGAFPILEASDVDVLIKETFIEELKAPPLVQA